MSAAPNLPSRVFIEAGSLLRAWMQLHGYTQRRLSVELGCTVASVQAWLAGQPPAGRYMPRLSVMTGIPVTAWLSAGKPVAGFRIVAEQAEAPPVRMSDGEEADAILAAAGLIPSTATAKAV